MSGVRAALPSLPSLADSSLFRVRRCPKRRTLHNDAMRTPDSHLPRLGVAPVNRIVMAHSSAASVQCLRTLCWAGLAITASLGAHELPKGSADLAPGYRELKFSAPIPGTYALPTLHAAADGEVIDDRGTPSSLHDLFANHLVIVSFIYTHCADPNGCPLASFVMSQLAKKLAADPGLRDRVRLISISFDPTRDTPATLNHYATPFRKPGVEWYFVVPTSANGLTTLLHAYGQQIVREPSGEVYSHQLRVFLIDEHKQIRNEYSASFLHVDTMLADLRTLAGSIPDSETHPAFRGALNPLLDGPGDYKDGYLTGDYTTRSRALAARHGAETPPTRVPLGLPSRAEPSSAKVIALGRQLFFDRRLSHNNTLACASCHIPEQGFTSNELALPVGIEGRSVRRNAPALYNVGFAPRLFHDGRETRLEQQVWSPLLAANEMGNPAIGYVLDKLRALDDYANEFRQAFTGTAITMETLGAALAAYERSLVSANSAFDRWYFGHDPTALSAAARAGFELFRGKGGCATCHQIGATSALFTDYAFHNTGIGFQRSMGLSAQSSIPVGPGTQLALAPGAVAATEAPLNDLGRYEITQDPRDRWAYRTPSLRNVALTAPYMHDGSLPALSAVVEFYNAGGIANEARDPRLKPLHLTAEEKMQMVEFLKALTGDNIEALIRDAYLAPIGDHR